ncbi:MAG: ferredoxin family protein [candidate division WOR-3 bacterium]|jgi:2-oxoglutarate ferredoxin oxidoreductase subunit delta
MRPRIDNDYCKGCNICVTMCPVNVYEEGKTASSRGYIVPEVAHPEKCVDRERAIDKKKCEICMFVCPDQAIGWEDE